MWLNEVIKLICFDILSLNRFKLQVLYYFAFTAITCQLHQLRRFDGSGLSTPYCNIEFAVNQ